MDQNYIIVSEEEVIKTATLLVNLFWFNTQLYAKHCAINHCNHMIIELNHHSDLYGYYQDDKGYQSIIDRIEFYKRVKKNIEQKW